MGGTGPQRNSVRSEQPRGTARREGPGTTVTREGDCERLWLRDDARTMYRGERRSRCNPGSVCVTEDIWGGLFT